MSITLRHVEGDPIHRFDDPLFASLNDPKIDKTSRVRETPVPSNVTRASITVDEAIERFSNDPQRSELSPKNSQRFVPAFRLLRELVSGNSLLTSVDRWTHARQMQQVLQHLPPNAIKTYPGRKMVEVARYAEENNVQPIGYVTAKHILGSMTTFFNWAKDEHLVFHSPFDGLSPLQPRKTMAEQRRPFSDDELRRLFGSSLYTAGTGKDTADPGRYWVPLLALYHGARMNELCQLRTGDVCEIDGIWCLRITEEGARQAGVNAAWAKYGTEYDKALWMPLTQVTHWTEDDVQSEVDLRERARCCSQRLTRKFWGFAQTLQFRAPSVLDPLQFL